MNSLATLKHVSASGQLNQWWNFDPSRKLIVARLVFGNAAPIDLDEIPVCSPAHPRRLAWVIIRQSSESWLLTSARMPEEMNRRIARAERFHPDLAAGSLELVAAPPNVQAELEAL